MFDGRATGCRVSRDVLAEDGDGDGHGTEMMLEACLCVALEAVAGPEHQILAPGPAVVCGEP